MSTGAAALAVASAPKEALAKPRLRPFRNVLSVGLSAEQVFADGLIFTDGIRTASTVEDLQRMFVAHGSTEVYARIGTNRTAVGGPAESSLEQGLRRARLARSLGLALDLEIGLWAVYGGLPNFAEYPQLKPSAPWDQMTVDQMVPIVRDFAAIVANEILGVGVTVNCWHLSGDERGIGGVTMPRLGPFGRETPYRPPDGVDPQIGRIDVEAFERLPQTQRRDWYAKHLWPHTGRLWAALAAGIRSVYPRAKFTTHMGSGPRPPYEPELIAGFFLSLEAAGYRADEPGICFFPSSAAEPYDRMAAFKASLDQVHGVLGRPFFVAEHAYPVAPMSIGEDWGHATPGYPLSASGQAELTQDLVSWGAASGRLSGLRQWSPELALGGWAPMSLFELRGKTAVARPSLDAVRNGLLARPKTTTGSD